MKEDLALATGFAVAGLGPLTAASILLPLREQPYVTSIVGVVLIVVIAASTVLASPCAGAVATVTAVLSFDFLFVRPYLVLKVPSGDEVWPVVALLALGSLVVVVVRRRWPPSTVDAAPPAGCNPNQSRHIERIVRLIEQDADPRDLTSAVQAELTGLLLLRGCRFETGKSSNPRPRIGRDGRVVGPDGVVPFAHGTLELPVRVRSRDVARFVLTPTPGVSIPLEQRIIAVILTDHLAAAITSRAAAAPN